MGVLHVLARRGDELITWARPDEGSRDHPEALAAVREAESLFVEQTARGATAFTIKQGALPLRIDQFAVEAEQIVLIPRVVGGSR